MPQAEKYCRVLEFNFRGLKQTMHTKNNFMLEKLKIRKKRVMKAASRC
jgi:hypothetical protein